MIHEVKTRESIKKDSSRGLEMFVVTDSCDNVVYEVKQHEFQFYTQLLSESTYLYDKLHNTFGIR